MRTHKFSKDGPVKVGKALTESELEACKLFIEREKRPGGCIKVAPWLLRSDNAIDDAVRGKRKMEP